MSRSIEFIISDILNGTSEERIKALDEYAEGFDRVVEAASQALVSEDLVRMFIADRLMRYEHIIRRNFVPLFASATNPEVKYLSALVAAQARSQEATAWLLSVASAPGAYQYDAARQLAFLHVKEVRGAILDQLRSRTAGELRSLSMDDCGFISGLLEAWTVFGEPLPEDLSAKLHADDAPLGVKVALKSLKV
jgi:hypothetical protein